MHKKFALFTKGTGENFFRSTPDPFNNFAFDLFVIPREQNKSRSSGFWKKTISLKKRDILNPKIPTNLLIFWTKLSLSNICPVPVINDMDLSLPAKKEHIDPTITDLWVYEKTILGLIILNFFVISKILIRVSKIFTVFLLKEILWIL